MSTVPAVSTETILSAPTLVPNLPGVMVMPTSLSHPLVMGMTMCVWSMACRLA